MEDRLGFRFPFDVSMSPFLHVYVHMFPCLHLHVHVYMFPEFHKRNTELTENGNFTLFFATGNRNNKLPFACCKRAQKTYISFPWSANDQRYSTIAVSANVPIFALCCFILYRSHYFILSCTMFLRPHPLPSCFSYLFLCHAPLCCFDHVIFPVVHVGTRPRLRTFL
jgi:hypothetical protein